MFRLACLVDLAARYGLLSCQPYATGLQQTVARGDETAATSALPPAVAQQQYPPPLAAAGTFNN